MSIPEEEAQVAPAPPMPPTISRHVHMKHIPTLGTIEEIVPDLPIRSTNPDEVLKALAFDVAGAERHVFVLDSNMRAWLREELADGPTVVKASPAEIARIAATK